jgi:hypothetical protein
MTEIIAVERVEKEAVWFRLKTMVLDSVSSPITRRVYNLALDEFIGWLRRSGSTQARPHLLRESTL